MENTHSKSSFNVVKEVKDAVEIVKLDEKMMHSVAERKHASWFGVVILVVPIVLNLIFLSMSYPSGFGAIAQRFLLWPMLIPALSFVGAIFLIVEVGKRAFRGKGQTIALFRTVSYVGVIFWLSVLSSLLLGLKIMDISALFNLSWLATLVMGAVVAYKMLMSYYKVAQNDAVVVVVIGLVGYFVAQYILGQILVGSAYRFFF